MGRGAPLQHAAAVLALVFLAAACSGPPGPTEGSAYAERVDRHNARVDDANASQNAIFCALLPGWLRARACGG